MRLFGLPFPAEDEPLSDHYAAARETAASDGDDDMTLMTRLTRLLRADFHAVLDHIEEPEALLRQSMREMEEALLRQEQGIRLAARERDDLLVRQRRLATRVREIDGELDLCLASGKDELAKSLLRRKLEAERLQRRLGERQEALAETLECRAATLAENRAALEDLRRKAELVEVHAVSDEGEGHAAWPLRDPAVGDDEVEIAFLREKDARSRT